MGFEISYIRDTYPLDIRQHCSVICCGIVVPKTSPCRTKGSVTWKKINKEAIGRRDGQMDESSRIDSVMGHLSLKIINVLTPCLKSDSASR